MKNLEGEEKVKERNSGKKKALKNIKENPL
jgi:hypothetical protein